MESVILLHGLGRRGASMAKLSVAVNAAGYRNIVLDYPSTRLTIEALVSGIAPRLPTVGRLHFVGHSLGGILSKHLARSLEEGRRGRIVQIGAPNFGSELAARAAIFSPVMGPALGQLHPRHDSADESGLDIGAIGGTAALAAYSLITGIDGENDGKVSLKSAFGHAPENKRLALPVAHSLMMQDKRVIAAVVTFLQTGQFASG